ncbi:GSCOCG00012813001-RA-CDS [Cotesia congregata]|nr:GSCOCG00012813001-RA-CDS [Cotesia congregata]
MSAVAAAFHPQHKLRWIKCLSVDARKKTIQAIKDALSTIEPITDLQISAETDNTDDFFDFSVDGKQNEKSNILFYCKSEIEITFEKYMNETRADLNLLNISMHKKNFYKI